MKSPLLPSRFGRVELPAGRLSEFSDERPVLGVRIARALWMGRHEVTVGQFKAFIDVFEGRDLRCPTPEGSPTCASMRAPRKGPFKRWK
nr:hypothetical protein [Variovorax sp. PAMC 28711]